MKKMLLLLGLFTMMASSNAWSQTLEEKTDYTTGYIKMDRASLQLLEVKDGAVYIGYWLIKVEKNPGQTFDIPKWVTRICPGAFSGAGITTLRFPASWTEGVARQPSIFVSPHAFDDSNIEHFEIYDDGSATSTQSVRESKDKKETARYDVAGRSISRDEPGITIIKYNDGSITKTIK